MTNMECQIASRGLSIFFNLYHNKKFIVRIKKRKRHDIFIYKGKKRERIISKRRILILLPMITFITDADRDYSIDESETDTAVMATIATIPVISQNTEQQIRVIAIHRLVWKFDRRLTSFLVLLEISQIIHKIIVLKVHREIVKKTIGGIQ